MRPRRLLAFPALAVAVLLSAALPAAAQEWISMGQFEGSDTFWRSLGASPENPDWRLLEHRFDAPSPQTEDGFTFRSARFSGEVDCTANRTRLVSITMYAEPALQGASKVQPQTGDWMPIVAGTPVEAHAKIACAQR